MKSTAIFLPLSSFFSLSKSDEINILRLKIGDCGLVISQDRRTRVVDKQVRKVREIVFENNSAKMRECKKE